MSVVSTFFTTNDVQHLSRRLEKHLAAHLSRNLAHTSHAINALLLIYTPILQNVYHADFPGTQDDIHIMDLAWLASTLESPERNVGKYSEELAFSVAQDIDWLSTYKSDVMEQLQNIKLLEEDLILRSIPKGIANSSLLIQDSSRHNSLNPETRSASSKSGLSNDKNKENECVMAAKQLLDDAKNPKVIGLHAVASIPVDKRDAVTQKRSRVSDASRSPNPPVRNLGKEVLEFTEIEEPRSHSQRTSKEVQAKSDLIPLKIMGRPLAVDRTSMLSSPTDLVDLKADVPFLSINGPMTVEVGTAIPVADQDYLEPINLDSPRKVEDRNDSAYFSAHESPSLVSVSDTTPPRRSDASAFLPPSQPIEHEILSQCASQSLGTITKDTNLDTISQDVFESQADCEPPSQAILKVSPPINQELNDGKDVEKRLGLCLKPDFIIPMIQHIESAKEDSRDLPSAQITLKNPFFEAIGDVPNTKCPPNEIVEDDEWLPRFDDAKNSPGKVVETQADTRITVAPAHVQHIDSTSSPKPPLRAIEEDKVTPGPLRAAVQAASAKATSYLRQARTAFGSPSVSHTKVFKTTTPRHSPLKEVVKCEPVTPRMYPEIKTSQKIAKASQIPSKTPRKSPWAVSKAPEPPTPRRSPRNTPRKGPLATQSMAIMAARNASAKTKIEDEDKEQKGAVLKPISVHDSPQRPSTKMNPKFAMQNKAKPVNIRVATASQREIEQAKERRIQPASAAASSTTIMGPSRVPVEEEQSEYTSKSQPNTNKKPAVSRQIKALAAANQAKEKAEKDQERREQQKRDIDKKRQENLKRQIDAEDKRKKVELPEEHSRKRQMTVPAKNASSRTIAGAVTSIHSTTSREPTNHEHDAGQTRPDRQSIKRTLLEAEVVAGKHNPSHDMKRQRVSEQAESRTSAVHTVISKPVRVSLQKKSLFGPISDSNYKKPGTVAAATYSKTAPVVEAVKVTTDSIRFGTNVHLAPESSKVCNLPPSELIELPEINSDYSDSDDEEDAKDGFDKPGWAETPELRKLLHRQQRIDPDDVFGPIPPLQMEEIFKGKERALARFRPRSSSANWSGNDKLSAEEVSEYARAMGYKN